MKVLIARMNHETNTFSPLPATWEKFGDGGPAIGENAYAENKSSRTAMTAFIDVAEAAGAQVVTPISAMAFPCGKVERTAFERMAGMILEASQDCDALMLDLHGAMVVEGIDDAEGELLKRIRAAQADIPIAVALDLHGNLTDDMVENCDIIVSFKTYPHVDMYETGLQAGQLLMRQLSGDLRPAMAWRSLPLMSHTLKSATYLPAMKRAVDMAKDYERQGFAAVSIFAGFCLADIPRPCMSIVAVSNGDKQAAQEAADRIADLVWRDRAEFIYDSPPLSESVSSAKKSSLQARAEGREGPVLLLDHSDNCMAGGTCDTMDVLQEALKQGLSGIAVGPVCDPEAVELMIQAGVGQTVTLPVGNKVAIPQLGLCKSPMTLTGVVRAITDGEFRITGPTYTGQTWRMGLTAVLDTPECVLVITQTPQEPLDVGVFTSCGINPQDYQFLLLKSRMYCRPVFEPMSADTIECDSEGVTSSVFSLFPYHRVQRPVYPLDPTTSFVPMSDAAGIGATQ